MKKEFHLEIKFKITGLALFYSYEKKFYLEIKFKIIDSILFYLYNKLKDVLRCWEEAPLHKVDFFKIVEKGVVKMNSLTKRALGIALAACMITSSVAGSGAIVSAQDKG